MSVSKRLLVAGSLVALLAGCADTDPTALTCTPQVQKLKFKLDDDGCVKGITNGTGADKDTIEICQGGTVTWKVKKIFHSNGKLKKSIVFEAVEGSPMEWADSGFQSDSIVGKVRDDAPTGEPGFKYTVKTERGTGDNCPFDPKIIVKPL